MQKHSHVNFPIEKDSVLQEMEDLESLSHQLVIERQCLDGDEAFSRAIKTMGKPSMISEAMSAITNALRIYNEAKIESLKSPEFQEIVAVIHRKLISARNLQEEIQAKLDSLLNMTAPVLAITEDRGQNHLDARFTTIQPPPERSTSQNPLRQAQKDIPLIITRQYEYVGGKVRIKIKVKNSSPEGLLKINFTLNIPQSFRLLNVEPTDYRRLGSVVLLNDLLAGEEKGVAWVLEPFVCGKDAFSGTASGVDPWGSPFAIPMNPLVVEVKCPLFANPDETNLPTIQHILGDLPVKSERVFFLPNTLNPVDAIEVAKNAISERDVRLVGTIKGGTQSKAFQESAWFYGITKVAHKRYVLVAAVSEDERTIRLTTACDDEAGCTGFLAEAGTSVRRELVRRGAVDSEYRVVELTCEKCGATLPSAPVVGRDVPCPECHWNWRVGDFFH